MKRPKGELGAGLDDEPSDSRNGLAWREFLSEGLPGNKRNRSSRTARQGTSLAPKLMLRVCYMRWGVRACDDLLRGGVMRRGAGCA